MTGWERVSSILAFRTLPTTTVIILFYAAIYLSTYITYELPDVPERKWQHGLDIDEAYADLHQIAGIPHPYNSHQNEIVHEFLLKRVHEVAGNSSIVQVVDDRTTNITIANGGVATAAYFEAVNILVKVNGSKPDLDGVLLSAHFDSVSTAPGATDDGMGVSTLLQMLTYFSKHQPKRTLLFNINNAEEDGLLGAHAFIRHPWVNLTRDFINLEGAGAGGRPLLLRASSTRIADAFRNVPHPHGNSISSDAFSRGLVRSSTDYSVYTTANLEGLDLAFYRQRSKYHTKEDSIPSLRGKEALWNMMESTLAVTKDLTDDENTNGKGRPVYFDIFGESLAVDSLKTFYIINIVLLIFGPLLVAGLIFLAHRSNKLYWSGKSWGQTPVALVVSAALTFGLGAFYAYVNPLIGYSSTGAVFVSCLAISFISFHVVLGFFSHFRPIPQQRSVVLLESFILWWIFLVIVTALIGAQKITGLYFVTFFYSGILIALIIGLLEHFELPGSVTSHSIEPSRNGGSRDPEGEHSTERTPLLGQDRDGHAIRESDVNEDNQIGVWLIQFLVAVPFPVILITQIGIMLSNSLDQTLADGSAPLTLYLGISLVSLLSFWPVVPFIHKVHQTTTYVLVLILAITLLYNTFAFPFGSDAPLKVFFQQSINLNSGDNLASLSGVEPWLTRDIISELPSSWGNNVSCSPDPLRLVPMCQWNSLPPSVASGSYESWVSVKTHLDSPGSGRITIKGKNTRNCRLYFDSTAVSSVRVADTNGTNAKEVEFGSLGVKELRLWSRTWEKKFDVQVKWDSAKPLAGRAACEWAEQQGIPALEEVKSFLPHWATVSKRTDGLLEGWKTFSLE